MQSRAEANARALAEREDAVRGATAAGGYRTPPRWLLGPLTASRRGGSCGLGIGRAARARPRHCARRAGRRCSSCCGFSCRSASRWVQALEQRRGDRGERLRRDIEDPAPPARRRLDAGRQVERGHSRRRCRLGAARAGHPGSRRGVRAGARRAAAHATERARHLTALLLELLDAQDDEQRIDRAARRGRSRAAGAGARMGGVAQRGGLPTSRSRSNASKAGWRSCDQLASARVGARRRPRRAAGDRAGHRRVGDRRPPPACSRPASKSGRSSAGARWPAS